MIAFAGYVRITAAKMAKKQGRAKLVKKSKTPTQSKPMSGDLAQYVTTKQAADMLGVIPTQINRLLLDGKLKGFKPGHDWLVYKPSVEEYFRTKSAKGKPPSKKPKLATPETK